MAVKLRLTRSGARSAVGSDLVVKRFLARLAPRMPWARMSRATWSRPTSMAGPTGGLGELASSVDRVVLLPERLKLGSELGVADGPGRGWSGLGVVVGGGGDLEFGADRLDPPSTPTGLVSRWASMKATTSSSAVELRPEETGGGLEDVVGAAQLLHLLAQLGQLGLLGGGHARPRCRRRSRPA